jgi:transposase
MQERGCPRVLGIDEHFFSRKDGYATTLCDLSSNRIHDVVLGRSEASLAGYLNRLKGKEKVEVICMDLSTTYRAIARKYFPNAKVVADRFHVVRLVNHHFLTCWRLLIPARGKKRGLLSLMRRHAKNLKSEEQAQRLRRYLGENPALEAIYDFKQELCELLLERHCNAKKCRKLIPKLLRHPDPSGFQTATPRRTRRNPSPMARRNRRHVEVHQEQRNHRRIPQQNGDPRKKSIRIQELRKLPTPSQGVMLLMVRAEKGVPPIMA